MEEIFICELILAICETVPKVAKIRTHKDPCLMTAKIIPTTMRYIVTFLKLPRKFLNVGVIGWSMSWVEID